MPTNRRIIRRGAFAPGVMPEVRELFARADELGVSMLSICRKIKLHHSIPNRWRRGQAKPNLQTYLQIKKELDSIASR